MTNTPKKRNIVCKSCGKAGHYTKTCSKVRAQASAPAAPVRKPRTPKPVPTVVDRDEQIGAMDERQFASVVTSREHGLKSKEIADEMNISLREVNAAFASATYEGYLDRRDRRKI